MLNFAFAIASFGNNTNYVNNANTGGSVPPYTSWATAATNIQDAIDQCSVGDLVLVTNGVYSYGGRTNLYGGLVTNRVVITKSVTVQAASTNPANTLIVGSPDLIVGGCFSGSVRCVYIDTNCTLAGFTLTNGYTGSNTDVRGYGGGVYMSTNSVISNCVITSCGAYYYGGGIYALTNSVIIGCSLINNIVGATNITGIGGSGGGIYANNSVISNCTLVSNRALTGSSANPWGGGVYATLNTKIYNSQIMLSSNGACMGGGGYSGSYFNCQVISNTGNYGGGLEYPVLAQDCLIQGNTGGNGGGGFGGTYNRCKIIGNNASQGAGGVHCGVGFGPYAYLYNCLVISNGGAAAGGGVNGVIAVNCTIAYNKTTGVASWGYPNTSTNSVLTNCIVYGNTTADFAAGSYASIYYTCATTNGANFLINVGSFTNNPKFVNAGDFHLQNGSPCIDAGINMPGVITNDLDVHPRPLDGGTGHGFKWDIGCYEYSPKGMMFKGF